MALSRPIRPGPEAAAPASLRQLMDLVDVLLEEIFLRLASLADLARASATCARFRRLIATPSFRRRYRTLHPPLLVGVINNLFFVESDGMVANFHFQPVQAPHPNAAAARALIDRAAAGFRFDCLPTTSSDLGAWSTCDVRDGLVLLHRRPGVDDGNWSPVINFPDITVYDPLSRRYVSLPCIPHGLLSQFGSINRWILPSLLPCQQEGEDAAFRVISLRYGVKKLVAFIFSSGSGTWNIGNSTTWDALNLGDVVPPDGRMPPVSPSNGYAYGCLYWQLFYKNKLLKLNISNLEFSTVDLPPSHQMSNLYIVEAAEARLGMFSLANNGTSLYYNTRANVGLGSNEWKTEDMIPLPNGYSFVPMVGASEGYIILLGDPETSTTHQADYFSLEVRTLEIQMIARASMGNLGLLYPYIVGIPPSMSSRRI